MLELKQLRQEAYTSWIWLQNSQVHLIEAIPSTDQLEQDIDLPYTDRTFKDAIRQSYGDLRYRETWEQAAINLTAHRIAQFYLAPHQIVGYLVSAECSHCTIRQHYGDQLIETMLKIPEILEVLQDGLEHLYHVSGCAADREIVKTFFRKMTHHLWPGRPTQAFAKL